MCWAHLVITWKMIMAIFMFQRRRLWPLRHAGAPSYSSWIALGGFRSTASPCETRPWLAKEPQPFPPKGEGTGRLTPDRTHISIAFGFGV
jgi:hypothetical protein